MKSFFNIFARMKDKRGYTLTELSISTSIIAMLAVGGLAVLQKKNDTDKEKETYAKIERIETALKGFIRVNGFIPCPAAPATIESVTSFGRESTYNTTTKICGTETGAVPVRTLGLPDDTTYDGWERKFTYRSASSSGSAADFGNVNFNGDIAIIDLKGTHKTNINEPQPNNDGAIYVIISHGANGKDVAYRKNDITAPLPAVGAEATNTSHTRSIYIQNEKTKIFDDIVAFGTKAKLGRQSVMESPIRIQDMTCDTARSLTKDSRATLNNYVTNAGVTLSQVTSSRADTIYKSARILANLCKNRNSAETVNPSRFNGLKLWLDAADRSTTLKTSCTGTSAANNDAVACWKDKSGSGNDATAVVAPIYKTNTMNGKPVLRFDGANTYLDNTALTLGTTASIFAIAETNNSVGYRRIINNNLNFFFGTGNGTLNFASFYGNNVWADISDHGSNDSLTTGEFYILESIFDGTNDNAFINGSMLTPKSHTMATFSDGYRVGATSGAATQYWDGDIGEIAIYNRALSTLERNKVEEYLSNKWGIPLTASTATCNGGMVFQQTASDPTGSCQCPSGEVYVADLTTANACYSPKTSTGYGTCVAVASAPTYASPPDKGGMALWLDANDCTTVTLEAGGTTSPVSAWLDKSGNGNDATQATKANKPLYVTNAQNSLPVLRFDGSNDFMVSTFNPNYTVNPNLTMFFVYQERSVGRGALEFLYGHDNKGYDRILRLNHSFDPYKMGTGSGYSTTVTGLSSLDEFKIFTASLQNTVTNGSYAYLNGSQALNFTESHNTGEASLTIAALKNAGTYPANVDIGEIIIYNNALSNQQRESVESYLSTKWNIIRYPNDLSLAAPLKLWLDASDPSTLFTNSTCTVSASASDKIGCWKDKSGTNNAIQATERLMPHYSIGALNGKPMLQFDGTNDYLSHTGALGISGSGGGTIFTVQQNLPSSGSNKALFYSGATSGVGGTLIRLDVTSDSINAGFRFNDGNRLFTSPFPATASVASWVWNNGAQYGQHDLYVNGMITTQNSSSSGTTVPNVTDQEFLVGHGRNTVGSITFPYLGDIGEIIVYNTTLTAAQRLLVERYLGAKWGVTVQ